MATPRGVQVHATCAPRNCAATVTTYPRCVHVRRVTAELAMLFFWRLAPRETRRAPQVLLSTPRKLCDLTPFSSYEPYDHAAYSCSWSSTEE